MNSHLWHSVALQQQQQPAMTESNRQTCDHVNVKEEELHRTSSPLSIHTSTVMDCDETDSKELEIHRCLTANGIDSSGQHPQVDLIHLRKLAESPGGLKTLALRRLAWPKLVAAHQVLWEGPPVAPTQQQQPAAVNSREIHRLVQRTKWSKYQITKSPKTFDELLGLVLKTDVLRLPTPRQSFADLSEGASDSVNNANTTTTVTNRIRRVSFDLDIPLDDVEELSHRQLIQMAKDERQVLRKLLSHIYRCHPDAPLYDGLQNLIAVLWIVIESPSLTSITSLQLIQYQWKPQSPTLFMKLLAVWDPDLHEHFCIQEPSHAPPHCIANSWIPHWFSNDLKDLDVLLRIWDVLLIHPPTTIVYFSVALVVHFRDSLLRAKQQPIFQAILHHLPSDGLEKYDMVEPILQRCCQALQDYPPERIIDSASIPPIPEWVLNSTAPTDDQVIQRLAKLRQVMPVPNPSLPIFDNIQLQPTSCMKMSTTEVTLTLPDDACPWQETPDTTPCSTPESVRSVRTTFQAMETTKLPTADIVSTNWVYKIVALCWVSMAIVAVAYSLVNHASHEVVAISPHNDGAPLNVTEDTFSSHNMDHSMATLPVLAPVHCPHDECRTTITPNYIDLAWPEGLQTSTGSAAHSENPTPPLDTEVLAPLQDYDDNMCHPVQEFIVNLHRQCEDLDLRDSFLDRQSPIAFSLPTQEFNKAWLVESMTDRSTTLPFHVPESCAKEELIKLAQLTVVPNSTLIDFDPAFIAVDHVDTTGSSVEQSGGPKQSYKAPQPKSKPTGSSLWSNSKLFVLGIGNFLLESTEAHLRGRREAHTLVNNVHRFVRNQANGQMPLLDDDARRVKYNSKSLKQENHVLDIVKVIHEKGMRATTLALEATAVRLDASRAARANATRLAAKLAQRSKVMTEDGIDRVYDHLLTTTNVTLNSVGTTTRAIAGTSNRIAHQISSVATRSGSKILRTLHGLTTKHAHGRTIAIQPYRAIAKAGQIIQGRMRGFRLLKPDIRKVGKEFNPSSQTVTGVSASSIVRYTGTVLHVFVSLLSQGRTVISREFARLSDQLAETFPQLRMLLSSGRQMLQVMAESGMAIALLAALSIKEGGNRICQVGTVTAKSCASLNEMISRLAPSAKFGFEVVPRLFLSGNHIVGEMINRFLENVLSMVPSMSTELRRIRHFVSQEIVPSLFVLRELGLHVVDIIEDTATSIGETTLATIVSALMAGKRTYRGLEKGGRNVLLASQFAWNCMLVYLAVILSATRQKIVHIGAHSGVDIVGNSTHGSPNEHSPEGAIVAAECVLAWADGNQDLQDWPPQSSISSNATMKPPGQRLLWPSLGKVQPAEVIHWSKVRPPLRRSRGAGDVAREALMKKSIRNVSIDQSLGLENDVRMGDKGTLQKSVKKGIGVEPRVLLRHFVNQSRKLGESLSRGSKSNLTEIQQRIQEIAGRTKKIARVLAHMIAALRKTTSYFLDNLALRVHYLQSILRMLLKNYRDRMGMFRGEYLNLTLREAEHSTSLAFYNLVFFLVALIEVGKKEMQHSSERQITAVQHVYMESWRGIEKAAALQRKT